MLQFLRTNYHKNVQLYAHSRLNLAQTLILSKGDRNI